MIKHPELYKIDSKGNTRVWWIESGLGGYRTHAGILNGKIVVSKMTYPEEKNVGKINETTIREQISFEVQAEYTKKKNQGKYHESLDTIHKGASYHVPMLAAKYDPKKHSKGHYISQPKLDGVRAIATKEGLFSRQGKRIISAPHVSDQLTEIFEKYPDLILDGELYNHELHDDFNQIISLVRKTVPSAEDLIESEKNIQYWIYDVMNQDTFEDRLRLLDGIINDFISIVLTPHCFVSGEEEIEGKLNEYLEDDYEGQMLRPMDSKYENKRSRNLLKHKTMPDEEFKVVRVIEGLGNWAGYCKSVEILLDDGSTQFAGIRGNQEYLKKVLAEGDEYVDGWATVIFQNRTPDGKLRFPIVKTLWKWNRTL